MSGALPRPLERVSLPSFKRMAVLLYSMRKYHLRLRGGFAFGSVLRCSLHDLRAAKKDWTQASEVWACSSGLVNKRIRCLGASHIPLCLTVRQKKTTVCE